MRSEAVDTPVRIRRTAALFARIDNDSKLQEICHRPARVCVPE
jgi:hypothetical protein